MVVFLADRADIQARQLHRRIANRFQTDGYFEGVEFRITGPREPGPYRVVAETDPQVFLDDEAYPVERARFEVGFEIVGRDQDYLFNWIEPERDFLLGWHRDDDHPDLGPVHVQVNQGGAPIEHKPATFIDAHPMAILEARLEQLGEALARVEWGESAVTGIDW